MAHIGFTPQSEHTLGGYRVQGRGDAADRVLRDAHAVQEAGAFAVVMEMVPGDVATQVTKELTIPTIGIGAGNGCDGQVLVWQDAFGLRTGRMARFVKQYADVHGVLLDAARAYADDVKARHLPRSRAHLLIHPRGVLSLHAPPPRIAPPRRLRPRLHGARRSRHRPGARGRHPRHEHLVGPGARGGAVRNGGVTPRLKVTRVVTGLDIPWDVQQLPGRRPPGHRAGPRQAVPWSRAAAPARWASRATPSGSPARPG